MTRVVVYGEAALHIITRIPAQLVDMPAMLFEDISFTVGGAAGTVCWQLAELGYPPYFVGVMGDDWAGTYMIQELVKRGVDCSGVRRTGDVTTRVLILVQPEGKRKLVVESGVAWSSQVFEQKRASVGTNLFTYVPGFPGYESTLKHLYASGARLIADLGFMPLLSDQAAMTKHALTLAPYLDTMILSGEHATEDENHTLARSCLVAGTTTVVTTLGARGALLNTHDLSEHLPAYAVVAQNTICAGDAFVAGFIVAQIEGQSVNESVQFGQAVAAAKVTRINTLPTRSDVETFLKEKR